MFHISQVLQPIALLLVDTALSAVDSLNSQIERELDRKVMANRTIVVSSASREIAIESADTLDVDSLMDAINIPVPSEYALLTIRELKTLAKERQVKGYSRMSKAELIAALDR